MQHKDDDEGGLAPAGPARSVEEKDPVMCCPPNCYQYF